MKHFIKCLFVCISVCIVSFTSCTPSTGSDDESSKTYSIPEGTYVAEGNGEYLVISGSNAKYYVYENNVYVVKADVTFTVISDSSFTFTVDDGSTKSGSYGPASGNNSAYIILDNVSFYFSSTKPTAPYATASAELGNSNESGKISMV